MAQHEKDGTTGHIWDDDLQEFDNPLPNWWLWSFYLTIIFSVVYWFIYPAWPLGAGFTTGVAPLNQVQYQAKTKDDRLVQKTSHWNSRVNFLIQMNEGAIDQKKWFDSISAKSYDQIAHDTELMQFVNSSGKVLFAENCAACHRTGGQGQIGLAPNLIDDSWIYGGTYEKLSETIHAGRNGMMPAFEGVLSAEQLQQVAHYVLSLSGDLHDAAMAKPGAGVFQGAGGCVACHGADGKGNPDVGSANLTDPIWLWADVRGKTTVADKVALVSKLIQHGVSKGKMPAWAGRLSEQQIKVLTIYVRDILGSGQG